MEYINKILGATGLTSGEGALVNIESDFLKEGDIGFVVTSSNFYIYKLINSDTKPTEEPFTLKNPPLILIPSDNINTTKRWHLVSQSTFVENIFQLKDKFLQTSIIKTNNNLDFQDDSGEIIASIFDKKFWIKKLQVDSQDLVLNLNAEFINGISGENLIKKDGSIPFLNPIKGKEPIEPEHLSTKNYVDNITKNFDGSLYIKKDGSVAFEKTISGIYPKIATHITTKQYVDDKIDEIKFNYELFIKRDGSLPFLNPVGGKEPIEPEHLSTKNYVDKSITNLKLNEFIKRDGSVSFIFPIAGIDPIKSNHLSTKNYVDLQIIENSNSLGNLLNEKYNILFNKIEDDDEILNIKINDLQDFLSLEIDNLELDLNTKIDLIDSKFEEIDFSPYIKKDGSIPFSNTIEGVDPVEINDLSTKNYVDKSLQTMFLILI